MSGKASKTKGKLGEREICEFLKTLYDASFIRVPASGAFVGGKNFHRYQNLSQGQFLGARADIIPPDHMKHMVIESKFYKDFPFHALVRGQKVPQLDEWIEQAKSCCLQGDSWFLIVKINRKGSFCVVDKNLFDKCLPSNHVRYFDYVVLDFEDFFKTNKDHIAKIVA